MRKIFIIFILFGIQCFIVPFTSNAIPAYPFPIVFSQPDGSKISIILKGDEKIRWAETIDGYSVLFNKRGTYEYAVSDNEGNMQISGRQAKDIEARSAEEISFLNGIQRHLKYSPSQIQMMKTAWNVYNTESTNAFPTTGNRNLVCILIGFSDVAFTKTNSDFNNLFNQLNYTGDGANGSVKDFYLENSYQQLNLNITVAGPFVAGHNMAYYGADTGSSHSIRAKQLVSEAVIAADPYVNYADFDNDNDGFVDGVYVIFAGYGQEAGASSDAIWSHASSISPSLNLDGKTIKKYSCSPEKRGNSGNNISRIGVICHEFGHVLGAPDYYDTNYGTNGQYDGTGSWDLMAGGSWNDNGRTPASHNAYTKTMVYNWAVAKIINSPMMITLQNAAEDSSSFYRFNTTTNNEYFLIENRQQNKFDAYTPGHGMIIYHVDKNYINSAGNSINTTSHQGMYPVCANANGNPPLVYGSINSAACPFPGITNKTSFTDQTTPNSKSWANTNTAKPITAITENVINKTISFAFMGGYSCTMTSIQASNLVFSNISSTSVTLNFNRGNGNKVLILAKASSAVDASLTTGNSYVANSVFGIGQQIGSGNFVVYNDTTNVADITGLSQGTSYYFALYEYNTSENCYLIPALTGDFSTDYLVPQAASNIIGATNVCKGQNNVTYIVPPITYATSYEWTFPQGANGYSNSNGININFGDSAISGEVTVRGYNPAGYGPPSSINVAVNSIPDAPAISQNANMLVSNTAVGNQWYMQGSGLLDTNQIFSPQLSGYYYAITEINNCQSVPSNIIYFDATEINEHTSDLIFVNAFPNPFTGKTTITYAVSNGKDAEISIINMSGQVLIKQKLTEQEKAKQSITIDASNLSSGIYFYKLKVGNTVQTGKLIIN